MPLISVIIPVYNVEKYIAECLESLINQTFKDLEILCIDDCGQDSSLNIIKQYAEKDGRIKIINLEQNSGQGAARNIGIKNASGRYVSFIDPDDFLDLTAYEKAYEALEKTGLDSVWFKIKEYCDEKKKAIDNRNFRNYSEGIINITQENICMFLMGAHNKVYNLDFIKRNNISFSEGLLFEDTEFYYLFYTLSKKVYFIDKFLYMYRQRKGSAMSKTYSGEIRCEDVGDVTLNIYKYLRKNNLFEQNRVSFLALIVRNIKLFIYLPVYSGRIIDCGKSLLAQTGFPEAFKEISNSDYSFLMYISKYDKSRKIRAYLKKRAIFMLITLIRVIPFSSVRRNYRRKLKQNYF